MKNDTGIDAKETERCGKLVLSRGIGVICHDPRTEEQKLKAHKMYCDYMDAWVEYWNRVDGAGRTE